MVEQARVIPFWFLNDNLVLRQESAQMEGMKNQGIQEFIVCARQGLPKNLYLNEGWFLHFRHIVQEAKRLDMGIWIYDDFNWPSGTMGGQLTGKDSPYKAKVLGYRHGEAFVQLSAFQLPYQHRSYVDVLDEEACTKFIKGTHEEYKKRFGRDFGGTIKGFFTDEPGFYANLFGFINAGTIPFTGDLLEEFEKKRGYRAEEKLSSIWEERGAESRTIRQDYFQTLSELYQERFLGRLRNWCHNNNLLLIGHLLNEENPLNFIKSQADPFAAASQLDWAGYDIISALSKSHLITATFARSVAKIYGKPHVMAEVFGGFGWEMPPSEMMRISEWLAEQGTNLVVPHALYYSLRNGRRHESPPSLMEKPYWSHFRDFLVDFSGRASESQNQQRDTAIYYPVRAMWAEYNPGDERRAREISKTLHDITLTTPNADYINDEALNRGASTYEHIVLPRATVLPIETARSLKQHIESGGRITIVGEYPQFTADPDHQKEFVNIRDYLYVQSNRVNFVGMEVSDSSTAGRLEALQYKVWHELTIISPILGALMIKAKHRLLRR